MCASKDRLKNNIMQLVVWLFPVLFLIDDILGFNGYQFTIRGKSIRIILFCISVAILCAYCICVLMADRISLLPGKKREKSLWHMLKPVDYFVLFFIVGNLLWATVVPLVVRGEMQFSLKDYSTILVLVLYFPLAFLIRTGRLNLRVLEKLLYGLILILAGWHCVMYIGDSLHSGFYASYYDFIDVISFGTAVRTNVIYGYGIIRVIQVTSVFLLPGIFLAIRYILDGKYVHFLPLLLLTFAICVTYTKSIWLGYALGLVLYLIPAMIISTDKRVKIRSVFTLLIAVCMVFALNYTVFQNTIFTRAFNTVRSNESIVELQSQLEALKQNFLNAGNQQETSASSEPAGTSAPSEPVETQTASEPVETLASSDPQAGKEEADQAKIEQEITNKQEELKDALGTQEANTLRTVQIQALLNKWKDSKLLGYGYGSYTEECIRSHTYPYMYEATLPALIMKLGVIGCLVWVVFIVAVTVIACVTFWKEKRIDVFWWIGMAFSYALAVQTNPFLFTFAGFSTLLYLLISLQRPITPARK